MTRALVIALLATGCATTTTEVRPLTVYPVEWRTQKTELGKVAAVAELGDELTVFGSLGALTFAGGALVERDASITDWRSAATIPGIDGTGSWMVGLDARGRLHRVRARAKLEPISDRFGLAATDVRAVLDLGRGRIGFLVPRGMAIADGDRTTRYDYAFNAVAGADGRGAGITDDGNVRVFDPYRGVDRQFALGQARFIAIDARGRVVSANERAIWVEDDAGQLKLRYRSETNGIHGLARAGDDVWFADGSELGIVADVPARTHGLSADGATLIGSSTGDVWTMSVAGAILRFSRTASASLFQTSIAAIHARVCAGCHGANAATGIDLSNAAAWKKRRAAIERRVLVDKTMPPPGHPLTDDERAAIQRYLAAP